MIKLQPATYLIASAVGQKQKKKEKPLSKIYRLNLTGRLIMLCEVLIVCIVSNLSVKNSARDMSALAADLFNL